MKVKLKKAFDTPTHRVHESSIGVTTSIDPETGGEWIKAGYAELVADEQADKPKAKRKRGRPPKAAETETPEASQPVAQTPEQPDGLETLDKIELLQMACDLKLEASESMTKAELLALIQG